MGKETSYYLTTSQREREREREKQQQQQQQKASKLWLGKP
jgi:hypothetical protein